MLDDIPGALWTHALLERTRTRNYPAFVQVIVAIDPAVTSGDNADDTGIIVAALGVDAHLYVLRDLTCNGSPATWARRAVQAYHTHEADRIVAEVNNGGDMVEHTLRTIDPRVPYRSVHASRGKRTRAEPIATLYERDRVRHVVGFNGASSQELDELEREMCNFAPGNMDRSPDRVDALVWAMTELVFGREEEQRIVVYEDRVRISPF